MSVEQPQSVDVQKFFKLYEAKIAELIGRIVYLEVENEVYRDQVVKLNQQMADAFDDPTGDKL